MEEAGFELFVPLGISASTNWWSRAWKSHGTPRGGFLRRGTNGSNPFPEGDLISKAEIMHAVWPETVVEDNNLTVQISALRRVLDQGRAGGSCIQTVPGRGYRFVPSVSRAEGLAPASISTPANESGGPVAADGQVE